MDREELKEKRKEYAKRYRAKKLAKDPDYYNRQAREYRALHREKLRTYIREYMREYFKDDENYKKQVEYTLNWYNNNKRKQKNVQTEE